MKQYCRYCAECIAQGDEICYCEAKQRMIAGSTARSTNRCKYYRANTIDVFDLEHVYRPREDKPTQLAGQISIMELIKQ